MSRSEYPMTRISDAQRRRQSSFGYLIQLMARRIDMDMKDRMSKIDVELKVFANLMLLTEKDGITQRELTRLLEFPEYFTSRTVDLLVKKGFAERRPDPESRRTILVFLTAKGRQKAKELPPIISAVNNSFLEPLDAEERKQLISLLHKVAGIDHGDDQSA